MNYYSPMLFRFVGNPVSLITFSNSTSETGFSLILGKLEIKVEGSDMDGEEIVGAGASKKDCLVVEKAACFREIEKKSILDFCWKSDSFKIPLFFKETELLLN